jgi:hypothetical protein
MADIEFGRRTRLAPDDRRGRSPEATYLPWYGIYVRVATPDAVQKINDGINKALQNPKVERQLSVANNPGKSMPLTELAALMKADTRG